MSDESPSIDLSSAPCGLFVTTADQTILAVNETFAEWSGRSAADLVGLSFVDLLTQGSRIFFETRFQPVLVLRAEVREVALTIRRLDGSELPVLLNARRVEDASGEVTVQSAIFDVTERQDYERQLLVARRVAEESEARVSILNRASSSFAEAEDETAIAESFASVARDAFAAADAAVALYTDDGGFRVVAGAHLTLTLTRLWGARPADDVVTGTRVVTFGSRAELEAIAPNAVTVLRDLDMHAMSVVGLRGENGPLGAMVLLYGRERTFDEAAVVLHATLASQASVALDRMRLITELQRLALHDQLTGLANRNLLRERLSHTLATCERSGRPMALLFLDLDGFKPINDELGHRVGDAVLQAIAHRIDSVVRESDIVGRFGGDEFLVICEEADEAAARIVGSRIADAIRVPLSPDLGGRTITTSIGIAVHDPAVTSTPTNDALVRAADAAMYQAKNSGTDGMAVRAI